jgi:hypothetical protein
MLRKYQDELTKSKSNKRKKAATNLKTLQVKIIMKISHNNPLVLMALTWSVSDARIIGGNNNNKHRELSDKYVVYAYNPCPQEVLLNFNFLNEEVHVNHGKCKQIGDRTPGKAISYSAYTKKGSDSNHDTINREEVSLKKASDFKNECGFSNSPNNNIRIVKLSCPKGTPGRDRALSSSDTYQVYA